MFLLILIQSCLSVMKYLYLGKTNCAYEDYTAYQDFPIRDGKPMICSPKIPSIHLSYSDVILKITILEPGQYDGIENLVEFPLIQIEKKYENISEVKISSGEYLLSSEIIIQIVDVNSELDLTFEVLSSDTFESKIETVTFSQNTKIHLNNIEVKSFKMYGKGTFLIDDFLKPYKHSSISIYGPGTAIDNNQVLNGKSVTLRNCNLSYAGSDGYALSDLAYNGVECVKRIDASQPKVKIDVLSLNVYKETVVNDFLDADIEKIYVVSIGGGQGTLTIETAETIYFPVVLISEVKIYSDHKIDIKEGQIIQVTVPLELDCLSGRTNEGEKLNVFYQIYDQSEAFACIMSSDITSVEFDPAFLIYPMKVVLSNRIENVTIGTTHFKGMTMLSEVNLICKDESCAIDGLLIENIDEDRAKKLDETRAKSHILSLASSGKLLNSDMSKKKPEYFTIATDGENFVFEPMKTNVTDFDFYVPGQYKASVALKSCSASNGEAKTRYRFKHDLQIQSLLVDENVEIEFNCNLMILEGLEIPASSAVIDTEDIGAYIIVQKNLVTVDHFPNCGYHRKYNTIQFIYSDILRRSSLVIQNIVAKEGVNKVNFVFEDDDRYYGSITVNKITCCRNVELYFQSTSFYVEEFTLSIDKDTLLPNPSFHPVEYFQMGAYGDGYIHQEIMDYKLLPREYKNLYIHCGLSFSSQGYSSPYKIDGVFYINGNIYSNESPIVHTQDMIIVNSNSVQASGFPKFNVNNTFYTTLKSAGPLFSNINHTTKAVITAMSKNVNISVKNDYLIVDNDEINPIDLRSLEVLSFYLPADDKFNTIRLNISGNFDKTLNFDLISAAHKSRSAKKDALIKLILDESLARNYLINGSIGYAFDKSLNGAIIYKVGENGVETEVKPEFLPISETEIESFIYGNDDGSDDDDDTTSSVISEETSSITSEETSLITSEETSSITIDVSSSLSSDVSSDATVELTEVSTDASDSDDVNNDTNKKHKKKLTAGIIAAIVVCVLVFVICVIVGTICIVKACRKNKKLDVASPDMSLTEKLVNE